MLEQWETFYLVVGTAAGALVGIMFIVATLTAEIALEQINRGTVIYQNPTVFHFAVVMAVSALALVPHHLLPVVALMVAIVGIAGLVYSAVTVRGMLQPYEFYQATPSDHLFFGIVPALSYLLLLGGGLAVFSVPDLAAEAIAAGSLLLLLVAIRNAWDVATFAVRIARAVSNKQAGDKKETAP